jgi:hypothetical protein
MIVFTIEDPKVAKRFIEFSANSGLLTPDEALKRLLDNFEEKQKEGAAII